MISLMYQDVFRYGHTSGQLKKSSSSFCNMSEAVLSAVATLFTARSPFLHF